MSVQLWDMWNLGSAAMLEDDTTATGNGGAIDMNRKMPFAPIGLAEGAGVAAVVVSDAADTTQTITLYGRDNAGIIVNSGSELALNGTTPVTSTQVFQRFLKATKSATCAGNVAIYPTGAAFAGGTAQGGGANELSLDAGDDGTSNAYQFMICRITGGTGANQIRQILASDASKIYMRTWDTNPDATSVYEIRKGIVLEGNTYGPASGEINVVGRAHYDAAANPSGGADKTYHEKGFWYNDHATLALTNAKMSEVATGAYLKVTFALETTLDGTGTNGSNTRLVAPSTGVGTFDSTQKDVANSGNLSAGSGQGYWIATLLQGGDAADDTFWQSQITGQSV